MRLDEIEMKPGPRCPECEEPMPYYGGTAGFIHCGWKILHREGELFENGVHVKDDRLAGGARRVDSEVHER